MSTTPSTDPEILASDDGRLIAAGIEPIFVIRALQAGLSPNAVSSGGLPFLFCALVHDETGRLATLLLRAGADPNVSLPEESTAYASLLELALLHGTEAAVVVLLTYGAEINAGGKKGVPSLHRVFALGGRTEGMLDVLLSFNPDANVRTPNGRTPMHAAIDGQETELDQFERFSRLRSAGGDIDASDNDGNTPLHEAATKKYAAAAAALLRAGANSLLKNHTGQTPFECAIVQPEKKGLFQAQEDARVVHMATVIKAYQDQQMLEARLRGSAVAGGTTRQRL